MNRTYTILVQLEDGSLKRVLDDKGEEKNTL